MIITCPCGEKKYNVDENKIPKDGRFLKCGSCGHKWFYKIEIDGEIILERENEKPQQFKNVKFYASDPWYPAWTEEYGVIEHLKINNGM